MNRRKLLAGAGAAIALAVPAGASAVDPQIADPAVEAWQRWRPAWDAYQRVMTAHTDAEDRIMRRMGSMRPRVCFGECRLELGGGKQSDPEPVWAYDPEEICGPFFSDPAVRAAKVAELQAARDAFDRAEAEEGLPALGDEMDRLADLVDAAEEVLVAAPATTVQGVLAKLDLAYAVELPEDCSPVEDRSVSAQAVHAAMADLRRLAGPLPAGRA